MKYKNRLTNNPNANHSNVEFDVSFAFNAHQKKAIEVDFNLTSAKQELDKLKGKVPLNFQEIMDKQDEIDHHLRDLKILDQLREELF